ncbi:hypothetical protein [Actinomadura bangladeshensis]|uniref:Uncharacterized protein n=1 Tax=Actinomadura bangladeshensis TaxID=453573 RepID=A0A6L9Q950_9ACTN|nr:hypothetical protein [Actinomadura bangladeshensis]NEA22019.1 hypothetical protein [Actinomadura bangladeshensis]
MQKPIGDLAQGLLTAVILGTLLTIGSTSLLPGQARLTGPLFCAEPYTDPVVVRDETARAINFTLYCTGERGERHEIGWLRPSLTLGAAYAALIGAAIPFVRRRRSGSG